MQPKYTVCLWFATYASPVDYPGGQSGDVLTVEFTVVGIPCCRINGGPMFTHNK